MAQPPPNEVNRVSVKIPPFWKSNPAIWFLQIEAQFTNNGITQDITKYNTILANVETHVLDEIADYVLAPPEENKYDGLKAKLMSCFATSEESKLKTLLQDIELGDKKPSSLLKEMRQLAGTRIAESVLKSLWLNRLPNTLQPVLAVLDGDLNKIAEAADKLIDTLGKCQINTVSKATATPLNEFDEMKNQIEALSRKVNNNNRQGRRFRSRSRSGFRGRSPSSDGKCYFHRRFGEKAYRCEGPPCKFAKSH